MVLVRDVMSTDCVTVDVDATLQEAVGQLLTHGVGSVIVLDEAPTALVTQTDALRAAHERAVSLSEIPVRDLCGRQLVSTTPSTSVPTVARRMIDEGVKKVLVLDGIDVVGIVTLTDVVYHLSDLRREAQDLADAHYDWES